MVQGVLDAVAHRLGDDSERLCAQRAADGVAAQRQHQAGGLAPPDAQVKNLVKAARAVGELALVDDKPCLKVAGQDRRDDLIEGNGDGLKLRIEDFERQVGRGERAGDGDLDAAQLLGCQRLAGDDHGSVAFAHAAAAAHQRVVLLQVGVGVEADGGYVEEGLILGSQVEGLDVAQSVGEFVAGDANLVGGQSIEHESVIGVGTVCDGDLSRLGRASDCGIRLTHGERKSFRLQGRRAGPGGRLEALNLCLYVSFLSMTGSLGSASGRLGAASSALHDDVTSHTQGCNQQPHERDEKNHQQPAHQETLPQNTRRTDLEPVNQGRKAERQGRRRLACSQSR